MSSMSKRAQARTERELQEILKYPGNSTCADCGARNPAWASWSFGIFLCMRCASLHRKLGTHISKVKSLTMDTWSDEQVQNMRKNGNTAVNQLYNPRNRKPDMPLDVDEVDNAMERFIRKKYQEKSLSDGRPEVPTRDDPPAFRPKSPDASPPPLQPKKKKGLFGTKFGLRSSSSANNLSKHHDGSKGNRVASEDYISTQRIDSRKSSRKELAPAELEAKLSQLRSMGFSDTQKNTILLNKARGDVELVVASLVKHSAQETTSPDGLSSTRETTTAVRGSEATRTVPQPSLTPESSNNPFGILDNRPQQPSSGQLSQQSFAPAASPNTNPWQAAMSGSQTTGLEHAFAGMQVNARPLFPHNTGGYANQSDPRFTQSMTPPVPNISQAYSATTSPISNTNPFVYQTPLSAHSTGSNPYASSMQSPPSFAPSTNPFMFGNTSASQPTSPGLSNPFGLPPGQPQTNASFPFPAANVQMSGTSLQQNSNPTYQSYGQAQSKSPDVTSPGFPNFGYGQPANLLQQTQPPYTAQAQYSAFQQQPPLMTHQTGRFDKSSIMALYNTPHFTQQRSLAAIPEPTEADQQSQDQASNVTSNPYAQHQVLNGAVRSVSMPVQSVAPDLNSRNPFASNLGAMATSISSAHSTPSLPQFSPLGQNNPYSAQLSQPKQLANGNPFGTSSIARHASADSVSVNNPGLMDGRHSPDAWGGLSARYVR